MAETPPQRPSSSNRRVSRRQAVRSTTRIECRLGNLGLGPNLLRSVQDLSETGMKATLTASLAPGQEVELVFSGASTGKPFKRRGVVVWTQSEGEQDYRTGLRFDAAIAYAVVSQLTRPGS